MFTKTADTILYLGNLGPAQALFQVLRWACYAAVASFLLLRQGFQIVFFYLCGWKKFGFD